jgi:hypothetical protein
LITIKSEITRISTWTRSTCLWTPH